MSAIDASTLPGFIRGGIHGEGLPDPPKTDDELAMLNRVHIMYEESKRHRSKWDAAWKKSWNFYVGKQWGQRAKWKASPIENYIFSKVETMLPILTDNRPRIHVLPREADYQEYAESMQRLVGYLWDRLNMDEIVVQVTKNVLIFGKGFYYTYWDPIEKEIAVENVDPQNIFVDKDATCINDCRYLIHVARMSKARILAQWPKAEGKFSPGARTVPDPVNKGGMSLEDEQWSWPAGNAYDAPGSVPGSVPWMKSDLTSISSEDEMVQVLQVWIRDPSVLTEPLRGSGGKALKDKSGRELAAQFKKYPGGRHVIVAGNRVIHDDKNPYEHGFLPYVEQDCHKVPGEFWCISAVQNLISPQMELNKTLGQIIDNKNLMGNNQWVVDKRSGIKPHQINAKPGLVIEKNPGSEVERIEAKSLPSYIINFVDHAMLAMDRISGVSDITEGRKPTGITAGIAIESLQEAAQTRLRLLVRNLENAVKREGDQWMGLAQQFYKVGRMIRVTDPATGEFKFEDLNPDAIKARWELIIAAGSTLPRSREVRQAQAMELFAAKIFDEEEVLNWIDHPGRDKLVARLKAANTQRQDMAMAGVDLDKAMSGQGGVIQ